MNNSPKSFDQDSATRRFGSLKIHPSVKYTSASPISSHSTTPRRSFHPPTPGYPSPSSSSSSVDSLTLRHLKFYQTTPVSIAAGREIEHHRSRGTLYNDTRAKTKFEQDLINTRRRSIEYSEPTISGHQTKMASLGLNSLLPGPSSVLPGLPPLASSAFALKLGSQNSPPGLSMTPAGLSRTPIASFPSTSASSRPSSNLPPRPGLPPNMTLLPHSMDSSVSSLLPAMSPLFQYPGVLASSLSPEEQQYLRMAQMQAANAASKGIPGVFKAAPYASRNYLELAMLVCNTFRGKLFPCPHCRYVTDRRNNLKRHVATMHQACDKQLECCGVTFATKASLREHIAIFHHNGYSCAFCGRRFCRKALLKRHLSVHNGQKDYTCPNCDYATSHKSNLERHKRIHARINVMGGAANFPNDDADLGLGDEDDGGYLDEPESEPGFVSGPPDRFSDPRSKSFYFQNSHLSPPEMMRGLTEPKAFESMMNHLRFDRRPTSTTCHGGSSGFSKMDAGLGVEISGDGKQMVTGIMNDARVDDLDSDSDIDIDIDGMEDCESNDSDSERKVSTTTNEHGIAESMPRNHDDIHPLNLVKIKPPTDS